MNWLRVLMRRGYLAVLLKDKEGGQQYGDNFVDFQVEIYISKVDKDAVPSGNEMDYNQSCRSRIKYQGYTSLTMEDSLFGTRDFKPQNITKFAKILNRERINKKIVDISNGGVIIASE